MATRLSRVAEEHPITYFICLIRIPGRFARRYCRDRHCISTTVEITQRRSKSETEGDGLLLGLLMLDGNDSLSLLRKFGRTAITDRLETRLSNRSRTRPWFVIERTLLLIFLASS